MPFEFVQIAAPGHGRQRLRDQRLDAGQDLFQIAHRCFQLSDKQKGAARRRPPY